jgi:hypothetical protein
MGQPLKFKSPKILQDRIDAYFESCWVRHKDDKTKDTRIKPYTVSGLAVFLDVDRRTILNYGNREEYFPTVKKAKARIEAWTEEQLYRNTQVAGVIFNLKNNYEWKDKIDNDVTISTVEDKLRELDEHTG